jgi:hypothetical protein
MPGCGRMPGCSYTHIPGWACTGLDVCLPCQAWPGEAPLCLRRPVQEADSRPVVTAATAMKCTKRSSVRSRRPRQPRGRTLTATMTPPAGGAPAAAHVSSLGQPGSGGRAGGQVGPRLPTHRIDRVRRRRCTVLPPDGRERRGRRGPASADAVARSLETLWAPRESTGASSRARHKRTALTDLSAVRFSSTLLTTADADAGHGEARRTALPAA